MKGYSTLLGHVASFAERAVVNYASVAARAYPGFLIGGAMPSLLSGRPIDWAYNAWNTALFIGFDVPMNVVEDMVQVTVRGKALKDAFVNGVDKGVGKLASRGDRARVSRPNETNPVVDAVTGPPILPEIATGEAFPQEALRRFDDILAGVDTPASVSKSSVADTSASVARPSTVDNPVSVPKALEEDATVVRPTPEQLWPAFERASAGDIVWNGMREGVNTALQTAMVHGVVTSTGRPEASSGEYAFDALFGLFGAGGRQMLLDRFGKPEAYRKFEFVNKDGKDVLPAVRYAALYPASWTAYSVYGLIKDAMKTGVLNPEHPLVPTELDPYDAPSTPPAAETQHPEGKPVVPLVQPTTEQTATSN
jgi:hypothetical protein